MTDRTRHFRDRPNRIQVIDDERKQALYLLDFELVPPEAGILDAPYKCYRINDEWAKIVFGLVSWLADIAPWKDPPYEDNHPGILEILKFLSQDDQCSMYQLRQNPTNPCLLEQSMDGGSTWTTAFDYSLCLNPADYTDLINQIIDLRRTIEDTYDGTITSVAPNVIGDGTSYDSVRELALCDVVTYMVRTFCEAELQKRELAQGLDNLFQAVADILVGMVGGIISIDVTPLSEVIARLAFEGLGSYWSGLSASTLENDIARQQVACCIYNAMDAIGFDREQWRASADNCNFPVGSDSDLIAVGMQTFLDLDEVWVVFLDLYEKSLKDAEDGYIDCPCLVEWESVLDLTTSQHGFVFELDDFGDPIGEWVAGVGLKPTVNSVGGAIENKLTGSFLFDECNLISYEIDGYYLKGTYAGFAQNYGAIRFRVALNDSYVAGTDTQLIYSSIPGGGYTIDIVDTFDVNGDELWCFLRPAGQGNTNGDGYISQVILRGIGIKPAGLP